MIPFLIGLLMSLGSVLPFAQCGGTSYNWSGYVQANGAGYVNPDGTHDFQSVGAEWTVPTLDCAATPGALVAVWVGVNGYGANPGLFQTGTTSTCAQDGTQSSYAWWTDEDEHYASQDLYPVVAGDVVYARVWRNASGYWSYTIRDVARPWRAPWLWTSTQLEPYQGIGATAEWVVEDPENLSTNEPFPFADFGTVHFSHMTPVVRGLTAIEMITRKGLGVSAPSIVANAGFDVTYGQ
jgi:hypothetical protein